jgi:hypothetical protein
MLKNQVKRAAMMFAAVTLIGTMGIGCKETVKEKDTTVTTTDPAPSPMGSPAVTDQKSSETTTTTRPDSNSPTGESTTTEKSTTEKSNN